MKKPLLIWYVVPCWPLPIILETMLGYVLVPNPQETFDKIAVGVN
jgi:hypothetical protein